MRLSRFSTDSRAAIHFGFVGAGTFECSGWRSNDRHPASPTIELTHEELSSLQDAHLFGDTFLFRVRSVLAVGRLTNPVPNINGVNDSVCLLNRHNWRGLPVVSFFGPGNSLNCWGMTWFVYPIQLRRLHFFDTTFTGTPLLRRHSLVNLSRKKSM
jgi:hypothetical protein